jgi:hypothetical protein
MTTFWNAAFLLKNLDTVPPVSERVTKLERDSLQAREDIIEIKLENKGQFNAILLKLEQMRKESAEDRLRAARNEERNKAIYQRVERHINKPELHEYRSIKK